MSNSTPRAALPPLPEPGLTRGTKLLPYEERYFGLAGLAKKLGYTESPRYYWTAEQVEQIRRETVQACAEAAKQCRSGLGAEAAILALLPVKEPKE